MMKGFQTRHIAAAALTAALLASAPFASAKAPEDSFLAMIAKVTLIPPGKHDSEMLERASTAIEAIKKMDLEKAHIAVNEALQLDARNSHLHFLNGFIYHLQAKQGDTQKGEIAIEGYQQALRIDPGNWIAQEFLGLAYMDLKQFDQAKAHFSEALLFTPDSTVSMQGLMMASYLTGDAATACAMADQFNKASADKSIAHVRSSMAVYASCGNFEQAGIMRALLSNLGGEGPEAERMDKRVAQWRSFYLRHASKQGSLDARPTPLFVKASVRTGDIQVAQTFKVPNVDRPPAANAAPPANLDNAPLAESAAPAPAEASPVAPAGMRNESGKDTPRMVLIDVVLLSTQEVASTSKGVNLLSALTLQLGSATSPAYSWTKLSSEVVGSATGASITRAVTIPALSYSLNIANANSSVNEVLARPTLAAVEGLPSEFFSGTNLNAGVVSTSQQGGTTIVPLDKRFGIKLAVTPLFLANGQVQMKVEAQRTSLNANSENPRVAYQIEIGEVLANANVVMALGETLVLSGLSEKSFTSTRDGVPGLQEVPGVQYLFSNKRTNDIQRSVLILVTPRVPAQSKERGVPDTSAHSMKALRDKLGLSGNSMPSNAEAIMQKLQPNEFFREFRQGDMATDRWDRTLSTGLRLKEAVGGLY